MNKGGGFVSESVRRLSEETRRLAELYMSGEVGRSVRPAEFGLSADFVDSGPTPDRLYAEAVRRIAACAPLRILPGEKLAGAATVSEAMRHEVPLTPYRSISHTTLGFEMALRFGYRGVRRRIETRLADNGLDAGERDFLEAMRLCLEAARHWHARHVAELERRMAAARDGERRQLSAVLVALRPVPEHPPRTFREAVQALWLLWNFQRLCGNWSGIGRMDKMLGPFLERDVAAGRTTLDEARELLAHFWIKGCEWITAEGRGSGDAQYYQNIVLAGVDEQGLPVLNAVTDLVLDVVEELRIADFPIAVRLSSRTPERLLRRMADLQRLGGGIVAAYNDDRIVPVLAQFGYPLPEARNYANDGCWELLVPGKTSFGYQPFDALLLQETLGLTRPEPDERRRKIECDEWAPHARPDGARRDYPDFEALYADFHHRLERQIERLTDASAFSDTPCPLLSLLVEDCIGRARSYLQGGPVYTVRSPHAGGLPDVANSLLVVRRLVYEEKTLPLSDLVAIVRSDWAGQEALRRRILTRFEFYGNDRAEADAMLARVFNDYTDLVGARRERHGVLRPAGVSTFGREGSVFLPHRTATASGQKRGAILAPNLSPTPGADRRGPSAAIRSHCSLDYSRLPGGTALDLKIHPSAVAGEAGRTALVGLLRAFVRLGGMFMQTDVVDNDVLRDAQAHPDRYPNLSVRVSGWSARFATLSREWQDMIIARTEQGRYGERP